MARRAVQHTRSTNKELAISPSFLTAKLNVTSNTQSNILLWYFYILWYSFPCIKRQFMRQ